MNTFRTHWEAEYEKIAEEMHATQQQLEEQLQENEILRQRISQYEVP